MPAALTIIGNRVLVRSGRATTVQPAVEPHGVPGLPTVVNVASDRWRRRRGRRGAAVSISVFAVLTLSVALPRIAAAVPSFASQTGLPCAQCHVLAFGPQLTEFGRQFKLNGYTFAKQDGSIKIPLAATAIAGWQSKAKEAPTPQPYSDKENLYLQTVSVYFAGRITDHLGAFV